MIHSAIIRENEINKILYAAGYRIGYQAFKKDFKLDYEEAAIWCCSDKAICVNISNGELQGILTKNDGRGIQIYGKTYRQAIEDIVEAIDNAEHIPAMKLFEDILFTSYDDNAKKAKLFLNAFNEFSTQLQNIYYSEAEALKLNCMPTVTFNEMDVFREEKTGLYKYIASVIGNEYMMVTIPSDGIGNSEIRDIRELTSNRFKRIDISNESVFIEMDNLLSQILIAFKPYFTPEYVSKEFGISIPEIEYKNDIETGIWQYKDTGMGVSLGIYNKQKNMSLNMNIDIMSVYISIYIHETSTSIYSKCIHSDEVLDLVRKHTPKGVEHIIHDIVTGIIREFKPIIYRDCRYNKLVDIANAYIDIINGETALPNKKYSTVNTEDEVETIKVTRQAVESNWIQGLIGRKGDME